MNAMLLISLYFLLNLIVTTSNKWILSETRAPFSLTALHSFATWLAASSQAFKGPSQAAVPRSLTKRQILGVLFFSPLFAINIGMSNLSLSLVSVALHQTIRATAPVLTVALSLIVRRRAPTAHSHYTYLSLVPITVGVALATYGDRYEATLVGFLTTFGGAVLAVVKTLLTYHLPTTLGLQTGTLIWLLTPLAMAQSLGFAWYTGEFETIYNPHRPLIARSTWIYYVPANAVLAALLNLTSFEANRRCGPVSMAVAGNLKQVLVLVWQTLIFRGLPVQVICGALVTCVGSVCYASAQQYDRKRQEGNPTYVGDEKKKDVDV